MLRHVTAKLDHVTAKPDDFVSKLCKVHRKDIRRLEHPDFALMQVRGSRNCTC